MGRRSTPILLFALLAAVALFHQGARLMRWADDYAFCLRDPVTNQFDFGATPPWLPFFYRPLAFPLLFTGETLLSDHPRLLHLPGLLCHIAVSLLLFGLLRELTVSRKASWAAAMVFLVSPVGWEVPFWYAALPTGVATALLLCILWLSVRFARRPRPSAILAIAALAFAVPCLNEQPAAAFPAAGIAVLAALPNARWRRAALPAAVACLASATYLALYFTQVPGGRGNPSSFIHLSELPFRLRQLTGFLRDFLIMPEFARGALIQGLAELVRSPLWIAPILASLALACVYFARVNPDDPPPPRRPLTHLPLRIIALGLAIFALAFFPVLLIRDQGVEPRLCYVPVLGLAIVLAGVLEIILKNTTAPRRLSRAIRIATSAALAILLTAGAVMMVGIQSAMRQRARMDEAEARALAEAIPDPPPGAVLLPLRIDSIPGSSGVRRFDVYLRGPLQFPWSCGPYVRRASRRSDLACGYWDPFQAPPVVGATSEGLLYDDSTRKPHERLRGQFITPDRGPTVIPWSLTVPFVVGPAGEVRVVASVKAADSGLAFPCPLARHAAVQSGLPSLNATLPATRPDRAGTDRVRLSP